MADKPSSSRRDFLTGRAAADATADALERMADKVGQFADQLSPPAPPIPSQPGYVLTLQRRAMACDFEVRLNATPSEPNAESSATTAALESLDLIEELESQLTIYRDTSEILELNRHAADRPVEVEPGLFGVLQVADRLYHETQGAFDLTAGPLSRVWGFDRRAGRMPSEDEIATARRHVGWKHVELLEASRCVEFDEAGVEINVNSIGKGYALDRAGELLAQRNVTDFLYHGGRSTLLASGSRAGDDGWSAGLRHPVRPQERIAEFHLRNEALSTSGSATQSFIHRGKRYGHLIDPRTGWPAEGLITATVIAPSAALADALSTAFYVMGLERVSEYCDSHREIKTLLVLPAKHAGEIEVVRFNF